MRINQSFGVSPELFLEAVNTNACDSVLANMKIPSMAQGDFDPHFSLANMLKDARYAMDLASRSGLETPGIAATAGQMQKLTDAGFGDQDFSVLYRQFDRHDSRPKSARDPVACSAHVPLGSGTGCGTLPQRTTH